MIYKTENLSFAYDAGIVLHNLNFSVAKCDYFCIAGVNGSGKSTLVKGLLGLVKPSNGTLTTDKLLNGKIGYLPQQSAVQKDFPAGVFELVLSGRLGAKGICPFYCAKDKKIAVENMKLMNVYDLRNSCFRTLSGGQQRRVLLARALCASEKLLLLDEPAAGIDPIATADLYELLKKINNELNITIVMVTHDINCAVKYAKNILHLREPLKDEVRDSQVFFGTSAEYVNSDVGKSFLRLQM
ncbi:hypothetical protein FACS1894102_3740 [Spirochaetia bacterium]|nr:hypothetical protein FACS1894102_3740 [Spirochaetia bacterium]